jgi:hypothetical protein
VAHVRRGRVDPETDGLERRELVLKALADARGAGATLSALAFAIAGNAKLLLAGPAARWPG